MSDEVDDVLAAVADRLTPSAAEREALAEAAQTVVARAEAAVDEHDLEADVVHVGSSARDTWLSGDRDIDVFVRFPPSIDRDRLREAGLAVGRAVLPDGEANYAEHPYITGTVDGFAVDVVPCVAVDDAARARTAVDRTPFHAAYVEDRLDADAAREVRLVKALCTAVGIYGSNLRTQGFGGYLLELLLIEFGSCRALLEAAADWQPPVRFDLEDHGEASFADPLVVIDPTDPERNVAAVVTEANVARFQHYARRVLAQPSPAWFEPRTHDPLAPAAVADELDARETTAVAVVLDRPDLVDDQLFPQLYKTHNGLRDALDRHGFDVVRSATFAGASLAILFECGVGRRPAVERHVGPPVQLRPHAERFFETYADDGGVYGPYVEGDRYVVERERPVRTPEAFLRSEAVLDVGHGEHLEAVLASGYDVLAGAAVSHLAEDFGADLAAYFDPEP